MGRPRKIVEGDVATPVVEQPEQPIPARSREAIDAEKYTKEYLERNRTNLSGFELRLAHYGEHPGWVRRWVVDRDNRVQSLLEKGWRFVLRDEVGMSDSVGRGNTDIGDRVSVATSVGDPVRQYLMETTQQLFDLQVEASMEPVRRSETALKDGGLGLSSTENTYFPEWAKNRIVSKLQ